MVAAARRALAAERAERIRSQERAEVAAHLHDSVLQTLALVQKRADDPREVAALARRQERELRAWLNTHAPGEAGDARGALEAAAAEVEERPPRADRGRDRRRRAARRARRGARRRRPRGAGERVEVRGRRSRSRSTPRSRTDASRSSCAIAAPGFDPRRRPGRPARRPRLYCRSHGAPWRPATVHSTPGHGTEVELVDGADDERRDRRRPLAVPRGCARGARRARGRASATPRPSRRRSRWSSSSSPTSCCSTSTCRAAAGSRCIRQVREKRPAQRFLALRVSDAPEDVIAIIRAGARGYVTKTISGEELADAVRRIADGDAVFSPRLAGLRARRVRLAARRSRSTPSSTSSPRASARSCATSPAATCTRRSPRGSASRPRRSRRTSPPCCASCSCRPATSSPAGRFSGAWSTERKRR